MARAPYGHDLFGDPIQSIKKGRLGRRFIMPPFSVLDARCGKWRNRKRQWLRLGLQGDAGRFDTDAEPTYTDKATGSKLAAGGVGGANGFMIATGLQKAYKRNKSVSIRGNKNRIQTHGAPQNSGTSSFDPVLCELMYKWFCPPGGRILDPFCGGATAGIVAEMLGYRFTGVDTRLEQIEANRPQAERLGINPEWICGDSTCLTDVLRPKQFFDFVWTDPPYFDLEVYGGDRNDGSMFKTFTKFLRWYGRVLKMCAWRLHYDRFFAVKIGEVRDKNGVYRNFVGETIRILNSFGLHYYNEIILMTPAGSLPIRAGKQFDAGRKIGKTHQNVLVWYKGDPNNIKSVFSKVK